MSVIATIKDYLKKPSVYYTFLLCLILHYSDFTMMRPFWYDEALTITEFVSLPSIIDIYRLYQIANNHITYSIVLKLWIQLWELFLPFSELPFRLLSLLFAYGAIWIIIKKWRPLFGFWPAIICSLCFCSSLAFPIYAVAVRGYMFSVFLALILLHLAGKLKKHYSTRQAVIYAVCCIIFIGIMPSNLLYCAALCLLFPPSGLTARNRYWLALVITPPAAFILFYLPIIQKFLNILSITHGWQNPLAAATNFYLPLALMAAPIIPFTACCCFILFKQNRNIAKSFRFYCRLLPLVIPLVAFFLRSPSPFPRVFFVFYPIYLFYLAWALKKSFAYYRLRFGLPRTDIIALLALAAVLISSQLILAARISLSQATVPPNEQDDMICPYFITNFHPRLVIKEIKKLQQATTPTPLLVLIDNYADPPALLIYAKFMGLPEQLLLFDRPTHKLQFKRSQLPGNLLIIVRNKEALPYMQKRFAIKTFKPVKAIGMYQIYLAE